MPKTYMTISGDLWDAIAFKTLGSEMYMDQLMAANLKHREITVFPAGVELVVPELEKAANITNLPPWKRK